MRFQRNNRFPPRAYQRGMSLLEIIIVIALIGGILLVIGPRLLGASDRGKVGTAKISVQSLGNQVENYRIDTGSLPTRLEDLLTQPANVSGWLGPYAKESALKDPWGTPIEYRVPGAAQAYDLVSLGADKKAGGESVDADIVQE